MANKLKKLNAQGLLDRIRSLVDEQDRMYIRARLFFFENARKINDVMSSEKTIFSLRTQMEANSIFVHVTKSGGTAVAQALFGEQPHHYRAIHYRAMYGYRRFDRMYKFAFVRNPWDRLYSAWSYLAGGGWSEYDRSWYAANISQYTDFNSFVKQWLTAHSVERHIHFRPQSWFLCDKRGRILVDYVGRFEELADDYKVVSSRLGIDTPLKKMNVSRREANYSEIYDEEAREIVAKVYQRDIALFNYQFDSDM